MVLVHWFLSLPMTPPVCCVPASTLASTISKWARGQTKLRVLGRAQVELVAWILKLWHASESGVTRIHDLWTVTQPAVSLDMDVMSDLFGLFFFYKFAYFALLDCQYSEEWQRRSMIKGIADKDVDGWCSFCPAEPPIIAAPLGDWSVSHITDEPFCTNIWDLLSLICTARWSWGASCTHCIGFTGCAEYMFGRHINSIILYIIGGKYLVRLIILINYQSNRELEAN